MRGMPLPTAVDLFAGAGGATQGLRDAGFKVLGAIENDPAAAASYKLNHSKVHLWESDIRKVTATSVRDALGLNSGDLTLLKACPPCQGFSSLAQGRAVADSKRNDLVNHIVRFVRALKPAAVLIENVPGLASDARMIRLLWALKQLGYACEQYIVDASQFGVPQRRKRLIVLAIRGLRRRMPKSLTTDADTGDPERPATVRAAFDGLATSLAADDPWDIARTSSDLVRRRIAAVPVAGSRFDLPEDLRLACHNRVDQKARNATASYGRMQWDQPAPTLTTRCTTPACGSFVHPSEHRGITLREAATLQTFPPNYQFAGSYGQVECQIGNAVPASLVTKLSQLVLSLVSTKSNNSLGGVAAGSQLGRRF